MLQSGWKVVSPKGERFSVKMAATPELQKMENNQQGYSVKTRIYRAMTSSGLVQVVVMNPGSKADPAFRKALLGGFKGGLIRSSGGKELSDKPGKIGPYTGQRVTFSVGKNVGEYWAIQSKGDIFVIAAVAPAGKLDALKKPFFSSFKLK